MSFVKLLARIFYVFSACCVAYAAGSLMQSRGNTLREYPEFKSAKTSLALGVNGAWSFMVTQVTLAGGALNLAAWHGHQKVILDKDWKDIPSLKLRVYGGNRPELVIFFGTRALRLSGDPLHPSAWLELKDDYEFQNVIPIEATLASDRWVKLEINRSGDRLSALIDGKTIFSGSVPAAPTRVAFQGSATDGVLRIDDLAIGNGEYSQDFNGTFPWFIALLFGAIVLYRLLRTEARWARKFAMLLGGFSVVASTGGLMASERMKDRYPLKVNLDDYRSNIETKAGAMARLSKISTAGKPVVLWLGGSQAWGAGASDASRTAFAQLAARFGKFEWINGAISGAIASEQLATFDLVASRRSVKTVIITTGVNDSLNQEFTEQLRLVVRAIRARGSRVVLIPEPVEGVPDEARKLNQSAVAQVAAEEKVSVAEIQSALLEKANSGFLWWDFVHLTNAGARAEASVLEPLLKPLL